MKPRVKKNCRGLIALFSKDSYDVFREEMIALSEGKTEFRSEAVNLTLKGAEKYILLNLSVMPGHEHTLSNVLVSTTDISAMKRLENDLRESEEKYRRIFETAHDAILLADTDTGIILEANIKAAKLLGMNTDEIVGMHFTQLHPKEEAHIHRKQFKNHANLGGTVSENVVICRKDSDWIPVSISSGVINIKGRRYISAIFRKLPDRGLPRAQHFKSIKGAQRLSRREYDIVRLIASGLTTKEVAENLCISSKTVQTHRTRIMQKLNLHRINDLVRYAVTSGMVE